MIRTAGKYQLFSAAVSLGTTSTIQTFKYVSWLYKTSEFPLPFHQAPAELSLFTNRLNRLWEINTGGKIKGKYIVNVRLSLAAAVSDKAHSALQLLKQGKQIKVVALML